MYQVKENFPIQNKNEFLSKTCSLLSKLYEYFPFLMLDTREVKAWGDEICDVAYKAFPSDGNWILFPDKMSIGEFLRYVKNLMEKYGPTIEIVRDEMDNRSNSESKRFKFYGDNIRVSVYPSGVFNHVVKLEISATDQYIEKIQSMADKLHIPEGLKQQNTFSEGPEELRQEFRDRVHWEI